MARKRTPGEHKPRESVHVGVTPETLAHIRLVRFASQLLYGRHGWTWDEILTHGLIELTERLRTDAHARGYPLDKLYADAGAMLARRRRVDRGETEPRPHGSGIVPPGADRPAAGGYGLLGIRPGAS